MGWGLTNFLETWKPKTGRATADPYGMTNKRADNNKSNRRGEMRGSLHCGGKCAASGRDDES